MSDVHEPAPMVVPTEMTQRWYNSRSFSPSDPWSDFRTANSAIVLVDLVNWQAHPDGGSIRAIRAGSSDSPDYMVERCEQLVIPRLKALLSVARNAGVTVVHARLASRAADYSDVVPGLRAYMASSEAVEGSWATQVVDGLGPEGNDISIVKSGSGAFHTSQLDTVLRNMGITTVAYAGVATNACVLLSIAAGFDLGYRQYLLSDCTAALTPEDQATTEKLVSMYLAQVVSSEDMIRAIDERSVPSVSPL